MRSFKDKDGGSYTLAVTVTTLRRVKERTGFLLTDLVTKPASLRELDPLKLFDVLHAAVNPSLDVNAFGDLFDEERVDEAVNALMEATIDFFPPTRRAILLKSWADTRSVLTEEVTKVEKAMGKVVNNPAFRAQIRQVLSTSGELSTSSPESSESTRGRSRSTKS